MRYREEIDLRQSRRSYDGELLEEAQRQQIEALIAKLNERDNLRITLVEEGASVFQGFRRSYGLFQNVRSFLWLQGLKKDENLEEKCGHAGEELVLEATRMNLSTCWVGGTFDRESPLLNNGSELKTIALIPIGRAVPIKTKEKLIHSVMTAQRKKWEELCVTEGEVPEWFFDGVKAAAKAPSALMRQKTRFFYRGNQAMVVSEDETPFDRVDLGIAKFHFECAADGRFELGNPAVFHKKKESENSDSTV